MMVAATRKRARFDGRGEGAKGTSVESLCRNKGGTISRMRSTFSTNAGSQAVKQIRPPYIRGVSVIPRAPRLWPPQPSIPEAECCGVKSTSLPIRMEVMCCVGSETLSRPPAGDRFSQSKLKLTRQCKFLFFFYYCFFLCILIFINLSAIKPVRIFHIHSLI